jgi:alpha-methylacyl-CoA racemase
MSLPLEGIRVLDLSRLLPGPLATQILSDFGAEVIKVEDTRTGDGFRDSLPKQNGMAARFIALNRNKKSLALDLKSPEGKEIFLGLAKDAQVVLEQFRPGVMARLGLDFEAVGAVNPAIVYCSLSGFGQSDGPLRNLTAHDPNYLALSGVLSLLGRRDGPPVMSGLQIADIAAALNAVIAILIALRGTERSGRGEHVDLALYDSVLTTAITASSLYFTTGTAPSRGEDRHSGRYPMSDVYETRDGGHVTISAIEVHFWRNLCTALGREEWIPHQFDEGDKAMEIRAGLRAIFKTRTRDEWFEHLADKDVCIAPVLGIGEALESLQTRSRGLVLEHDHPDAGPTRMLASAFRLAGMNGAVRSGAPRLGQHSAEILKNLGYPAERVAELARQGVIREDGR